MDEESEINKENVNFRIFSPTVTEHFTPTYSHHKLFQPEVTTPSAFLKPPLFQRDRAMSTPNAVANNCTMQSHISESLIKCSPVFSQLPHKDSRMSSNLDELKERLFPEETDSAMGDSQPQLDDTIPFEDLSLDDEKFERICNDFHKRKRSESSGSSISISGCQKLDSSDKSSDSNDYNFNNYKTPCLKLQARTEQAFSDNMDNFMSPALSDASLLSHRQDSGIGSSFLSQSSCSSKSEYQSPHKRAAVEYFSDIEEQSESFLNTPILKSPVLKPVFKNQISFSPLKVSRTSPASVVTRLFHGFDLNRSGEVDLSFDSEYDDVKEKKTCVKFTEPLSKDASPKKLKDIIFSVPVHIIGESIGKQHFDIIKQLHKQDLGHIISYILSQVRQKDIFRCSKVSRAWDNACKSYPYTKTKLRELRDSYIANEAKYGRENTTLKAEEYEALLKTPTKRHIQDSRHLSSGFGVLSNLQTKAKTCKLTCTPEPPKVVLLPKTPSGKNHYIAAPTKFEHNQKVKKTLNYGETLIPCPNCSWTAKIYNSRQKLGQCYNPDCRFRFCSACKPSHAVNIPCPITVSLSPHVKVKNKTIAGSKKSLRNIKRRLR